MSEEKAPEFQETGPPPTTASRVGLGLMGAGVAAYSAVCGIGGGLFMTPILHYARKLPLKTAVATSLALVSASATSATISELLNPDGRLTKERAWLVAALVIGSLFGAQAGFRVAKRLDVTILKVIFAVVLMISGVRLLFSGDHDPSDQLVVLVVTNKQLFFASVVGFAAGFLAPLLGIGGGLVAVPAIFFGIPGLEYLGARACGMAMGACASSRSLWLYMRQGLVDRRRAIALASGAVIGAAIGVKLAHIPGAEPVAKRMMGVTLWIVSVRFVWDVVKSLRERAAGSEDQA